MSVRIKSSPVQAAELSNLEQLFSPPIPSQTSLRKSAAAIRDAEKRKGIPKLDSACMLVPLEFTKLGGGEHCEHLIRVVLTALTIVSRGVDFSFARVILLPSSHDTSMLSDVSDCLTQRVVLTFAVACCVRVAARPVWHTPPWSVVYFPATGTAGLSDL